MAPQESTGSLVPSLSHLGNFLSFLQGALLPFITQWNSENEPRTQECVSFYKIRASGFLELPGFLPPARCRIWWDRAEVDGRTGKWSKTEDSVQQVLKDSSVTVNRSWKADNREWMAGSGFEVPTHLPHLDSFQDVWDFPILSLLFVDGGLWVPAQGNRPAQPSCPSQPQNRSGQHNAELMGSTQSQQAVPFPLAFPQAPNCAACLGLTISLLLSPWCLYYCYYCCTAHKFSSSRRKELSLTHSWWGTIHLV